MGMSDLIFRDAKTLEIDIGKIRDALLATMSETDFSLSDEEKRTTTSL